MEIIILKSNLKNGLAIIGKIGSENLTLPILKNCLIETFDNKLKISATNLEMAVSSYISAKIIKDGEITIPLNIFSSIINNLQNERINIESKNTNLKIITENYNAKIQGIKKEEFPIIPKIENKTEFIEIENSILREAILSVINASQLIGTKLELNGILFDFQIGFLKLAATDSFRLAEKTIDEKNYKTNFNKKIKNIIPLKTLHELIRILPDNNNKITIYFDENQVLFKTEEFELISRIINGDFPDYEAIIPKKTTTEISVQKEQLINAIKLTGSFSDRLNEIKIIIKDGAKNLEIFSSNPTLGENQYLIPAKIKGGSMDIVFNWKFLLDGIRNIDSESIFLGLNGDNKPVIIKTNSNADYFYILMPIKSE
ncbi:DNA polymerase III subunit beta [Candidatus Wolfebacteria bacterium CG10_big_fil_rev_8_21_14_0_10_31_9]|uniref:Beta sliding clamp n=1 Tax=Candidatus Wolfebacteria bacterium CG10_big_fil_rev_8_21_14_0_10_31_9 TaxID=1975070 RepID=A0A2H0RED1_9BACT|nr:MAG: DNA polymerase III subunit beta [Candidatus Wolfebacteria bacterium CG10_big_fil_rev_8_21_14_0_10_31_9]